MTESCADSLDLLARDAVTIGTPCGDGDMVWRCWGDGPAVVLLHGGYGSWTHWLRNIGPLKERYRVIAADLPGLGQSAMPPVPYTPQSIAEIVDRGLDTVLAARERFHLVGFSFGALIGSYVARSRAEQPRSFTLVGAASMGLRRGPMEELRPMRHRMSADDLAELQRTNLAILMIADAARIDDLAIHLQTENVARARVRSRPFAPTDLLRRVLPEIAAPLGGIWGEYDATAYPYVDERRELLQTIRPGTPFDVIAGAGHWVQYEAPHAFNRVLLDRLQAREGEGD